MKDREIIERLITILELYEEEATGSNIALTQFIQLAVEARKIRKERKK